MNICVLRVYVSHLFYFLGFIFFIYWRGCIEVQVILISSQKQSSSSLIVMISVFILAIFPVFFHLYSHEFQMFLSSSSGKLLQHRISHWVWKKSSKNTVIFLYFHFNEDNLKLFGGRSKSFQGRRWQEAQLQVKSLFYNKKIIIFT